MVENAINTIKFEKVKACAERGVKAVRNAEPVQPLPTESFPKLDWQQMLDRGPEIYHAEAIYDPAGEDPLSDSSSSHEDEPMS